MASWLICTGEYPPGCGGVGDYTAQLSAALAAAGDRVAICTPRRADAAVLDRNPGVEIVELPDAFGRAARRAIGQRLANERWRLLVQYVPNAFGLRGANLPWCRWLLHRARANGDDVRVMFHEPYFYFEWGRPDRSALAIVQRAMAATLVRAASHVYVSTASWQRYLGRYADGAGTPLTVLPIPSSIPRCERTTEVAAMRARYLAPGTGTLVGHFGTYGAHVATMLRSIVPALLVAEPRMTLLCIGRGSEAFVEAAGRAPELRERLRAAGRLAAGDVAAAIAGCDLMIQPYPDGATTRRTSLMAGLINGRPVLTTSGALTEQVWTDTGAAALAPADDVPAFVGMARALIADPAGRHALAARAGATYRAEFAIEHTVEGLHAAADAGSQPRVVREPGAGEAA